MTREHVRGGRRIIGADLESRTTSPTATSWLPSGLMAIFLTLPLPGRVNGFVCRRARIAEQDVAASVDASQRSPGANATAETG